MARRIELVQIGAKIYLWYTYVVTGLIRVESDDRVIETSERQAAVAWPVAVHAHLDSLLEAVQAAGERTSRKEIAAALVSAARPTAEELGRLLRWYRQATVGELLDLPEGHGTVTFESRAPGPRRRDKQGQSKQQ